MKESERFTKECAICQRPTRATVRYRPGCLDQIWLWEAVVHPDLPRDRWDWVILADRRCLTPRCAGDFSAMTVEEVREWGT
jgi:hypothetical protein